MNTSNLLYNVNHIQLAVASCATWIDTIISQHPDTVLCPILQSSCNFYVDVGRQLHSEPTVDFISVTGRDDHNNMESLYVYKAPDPMIYRNKRVILLDTVTYTGRTLKTISQLLLELGASTVYQAVLFKSQFSQTKLSWCGYTISDEILYGYGMDLAGECRTLKDVYYVT